MSPEERARRAVAIKALLDDENVKTAFSDIRGDFFAAWAGCFEPVERENLWRAVQVMDRLQKWLLAKANNAPSNAELQAIQRVK